MGWAAYKETLIKEGAMNISREIIIRAFKSDKVVIQNDNEDVLATKLIHFQRHGQGYHNLIGDITRYLGADFNIDDNNPSVNPFVRDDIHDSPLTSKGRQEAASKQTQTLTLSPEVIIVSPLHRAIQTALISFKHHLENGVPFIAHDDCREQLGLLTCNKALPLSQTIAEFHQVDFEFVTHGEDDYLWHKNPNRREHPLDEANRAYKFMVDFIMNRKETEIAIVCHSAWLFNLCNCVMDCNGDDSLESWFGTSEIRSMTVKFLKNNTETA